MAKLIGNKPDQVPTNGDLGTLAFQDSDNVIVENLTSSKLVVEDNSTDAALRVTQTGTGNALVVEDSANPDATAFIIDASGNVLVGQSTSIAPGVGNTTLGAALQSGAVLCLSRGSTPAMYLNVNADSVVAQFRRSGSAVGSISVTTTETAYNVSSTSTGMVGDSSSANVVKFQTNGNERMRIDSSGNVNISNLSASSDVQTDASKNLITTSDARLKNDLGVITDSAINVVQQIIPKYFSWKNDENNTQQLGFFAQDIYPVLPEAAPRALKYIEVGKDENDEPILEQVLDEEGNPDYEWGFTDRPIIAMCVKAIQEQQALIESQQSQIDALTARIEVLEAN